MANNRIPRNAKKIYITWKVDTTGSKAGDRATVEKTERGWILTTESSKRFYMPLALLRNADAVQVDQIETDEPNNRKDVLLSDIGTQVYIIDGASRTDKAAQAVIAALCNSGRITGELAERARNDRPTLDKIKRNLLHVQMEERETETGMRWTFYTASGVYMDIPAYSHNYIRADKHGNLYPTEAPTEPETIEAAQDTACTDKEPQEGTEDAQKTADKTTDMETFKKAYSAAYSHLYDHAHTPAVKAKTRIYSALFDEQWEQIKDAAKAFCQTTSDLVSSDREAAAFMIALEAVGAPTDGETATDGETTTTPETEPQRATEPPKKAIQTGERLYSHPHRHMVIVEGLQGDLVRVIYKGRLYLVCSSDLYTDETETTPAQMENDTTSATEGTQEGTQTAGTSEGGNTTTPPHTEPLRATDAAGGSVSQSDRRTRPAAPQSHGTTKGIQRHHRPPKTAYRAIQRDVHIPAEDRRRVAASRGSPKICIFWE